ncbi:transmembrane BAX inhibitor motif containing 1a [Denticeps clupeoides]|uniref:Uncharacterized protein n=1 Tax=Denticeps clupeoides TaxID=299321 RepID=A0AAY4AJ86_9TELE|nr:protein lifeguard 3-like [Denticeps clupeoides]XP_028833720.1 protein lifeguard 3-like [Denticeps clupeoides]
MSRSDFPPGYDELPSPHYNPQSGGYPGPPSYGFSPPGQPQPGPYPGAPQTQPSPPYPGQPAPYPGQPFPGAMPGPGFPPSGMPTMPPIIPPVIPIDGTGDDDGDDTEGFVTSRGWDSLTVRHAFIRKVYIILAVQLLVTFGIVAIFVFVQPVRSFVVKNPGVYWASYAVYFGTHISLVCCQRLRRRFPLNLILLTLFTLALSYMTGTISSYYNTKAVFLALGITVIVCIAVTIFSIQTKLDFTKCAGLFCVLGIVVMVTGIITSIVLIYKYILWLHMLYAAIGAIVFTMFLAYHTQLLIGKHKHSINPEEYVFGALALYVDIIQIFLFLLQIIGLSK